MHGIIYKAVSPNGKTYIGQTTRALARRKSDHAFRARVKDQRTAFQIAILEHGGVKAFTRDEIDTAETAEELNAKEKRWVAYFKADNPQYGYNGTGGGISCKANTETRRKLSGENNHNYGKHHSPETRQKMSEAHIGKPKSTEHRRKIGEAIKGEKHHFLASTTPKKAARKRARQTGA